MRGDALSRVLPKLSKVRRVTNGFVAQCPAHDDANPSLSVAEADGRVLLNCHAGCAIESIVAALGLTTSDLFDELGSRTPAPYSFGREVERYVYTDRHGEPKYSVVRYEPKNFRPFLPDGRGGWATWPGLGSAERMLYRLPELLEAVARGVVVHVVEGEKDVETLRRHGLVATTLGGSTARWTPGNASHFRDARVVLIPDNDEPGREYARRAASALIGVAADVRQVSLPGVSSREDVSDWLNAGHDASELSELISTALPLDVDHVLRAEADARDANASRIRETAEHAPHAAALITVRLSEVSREDIDWLWPSRLPYGKLFLLEGDPGTGKSLLTMAIASAVTGGRPLPGALHLTPSDVLFIAMEDEVGDTIRPRGEAAGAVLERIHVVRAVRDGTIERPPRLPDDVHFLQWRIEKTGARLVIIDPLNTYLSASCDTYKAQDVQRALLPLSQLAANTGACVLAVRHLTKRRGGRAIAAGGGSMGIVGTARGALLLAECPDDPSLRVLAVAKSNLAPKPASLALRIEGKQGMPFVTWEGESPYSADDLVADPQGPRQGGALDISKKWLSRALESGPRGKAELVRAADARDISIRTLERAAQELMVSSKRGANGSGTVWELAELANPPHVGELASTPSEEAVSALDSAFDPPAVAAPRAAQSESEAA